MIKEMKVSEYGELDGKLRAELARLIPEEVKRPVVIGNKTYWLYPPSRSDFQKLLDKVSKFFTDLAGKNLFEAFTLLVKKVLPEILSMMGVPDNESPTTEQIAYLIDAFLDMAIRFKNLPEQSRKNLTSLWRSFQIPTGAISSKQSSPDKMPESSSVSSTSSAPKSSEIAGSEDAVTMEIIAGDAPKDA